MATLKQTIMVLLSIFTFSCFLINSSKAGDIGKLAIYWGQSNLYGEGTLEEICVYGNYDIVLIAFLDDFGNGQTPKLQFGGHCGEGKRSPCTILESDIKVCQSKGIKVFLSLGGTSNNNTLASAEDAKKVAKYLYSNFLSGQYGPLGNVTLDGIDLYLKYGSALYYDVLVKELDALGQPKKFDISAAPNCTAPDEYIHSAITTGLVDYLFVQFYDNPSCQYEYGNLSKILNSWEDWSRYVTIVAWNTTLFLGLPADVNAAEYGGFIPPNVLNSWIPYFKQFRNYGGVELWNAFWDHLSFPPYSQQIKNVSESALQFQ